MSKYESHPHKTRNVRIVHAQERQSVNDKIAVALTKNVGSMWCAYSFIILALVGLLAILGVFNALVALLVAWTSQTLIQLVLLPVIMVGQNVLNRHQELQADETYSTSVKIHYDTDLLINQNNEIIQQNDILIKAMAKLLEKVGV